MILTNKDTIIISINQAIQLIIKKSGILLSLKKTNLKLPTRPITNLLGFLYFHP